MNANELRINNILNHNNGHNIGAFTVELVHIDDIVRNNEYAKQYEPIPLTEEWLFRFGFEFWCDELGVKAYYKTYGVEYFCVATNGFWQLRSGLKTYDLSWQMHNYPFIKYVHQLQNLYFALTGEELNLHK